MITTGEQLKDFITGLNGGATIDEDLLGVIVATAQTIIEQERPYVVLRKTDTSKTVTNASTWSTPIDLSSITDLSTFYGEWPITLFDGGNRVERYRLVPFDRRLQYKDVSNSATFDENTKTLYLNGSVPFSGTLYINYISTATTIDITSQSAVWTLFPSRFLPLIGFYAVGVHKGAVDYDSINKQMLPSNQAVMLALKNALEKWDNDKQMTYVEHNDPTEYLEETYRSGAVNT
jgi:hypothetical protein